MPKFNRNPFCNFKNKTRERRDGRSERFRDYCNAHLVFCLTSAKRVVHHYTL